MEAQIITKEIPFWNFLKTCFDIRKIDINENNRYRTIKYLKGNFLRVAWKRALL